MIPLIDKSPNLLPLIAEELGATECGQLCTPLTNYAIHDGMFAIDNGGYTKQDMPAFDRLLAKAAQHKQRCKFVVVPDVPKSAIRTLELFDVLSASMSDWPLAVTIQNGQEALSLPWNEISAIFIAGDDAWRKGEYVEHIIKAAKWLGKWVHVGRVNTPEKWEYWERLGADSCDGSGIARYSHMRFKIRDRNKQGSLFI